MYQSLWEEDARFHYQDPTDNLPFFELSTSPTSVGGSFLIADLTRHQGLNGISILIERCRDDVAGNEDNETLFEGHYSLDGAAWPPGANDGDGQRF